MNLAEQLLPARAALDRSGVLPYVMVKGSLVLTQFDADVILTVSGLGSVLVGVAAAISSWI